MGTSFSTSAVLNVGQVNVLQATAPAVTVIAANSQRKTIQLSNTGANPVAISHLNTVTFAQNSTSPGFIIPAGAILTLGSHVGPIFAVSGTGTNILSFIEESEA